MQLDESIFKAYDIRGKYPGQINEDLVYKIGRAYSTFLSKENPQKKLNIVISSDMRLSSPCLKESLIKGIIDSGFNVIDIGLATTPTFYFAVAFYGYDGGLQVSASHNPKEYNGLKIVRKKSFPISGEGGIYEIRDIVKNESFINVSSTKGEIIKKEGVLEAEVKEESKGINLEKIKPFRIAIDAANSMGAVDIKEIFKSLPCEVIEMNFELDGTFPVHEADPLKEENMKFVQDKVLKDKADLGISIDGDGDRYFFVDEKGETVPQSILRGLMAQIAIKENPGSTVCYDIRPGKITKDMIEEVGGKAVVTKVGHSLIKEKMIELDAVFGGESSGHFFYKFDFGTFEAPTTLIRKFLVYISEQNKPLSEIIKPYKKYFHSGEINTEVEDKEGKMKEIAERYSNGKISYLDGVTIEYPDYWFIVRPSNTESLLRFIIESTSKEKMEEKRDEIINIIKSN
ncbi:phosphomannomutase/phosphoglucomutase [Patescibacteria group bacterium]|nr:phosphomannomutase/phosphoglucomutase [Patescibacteria group bacterium]MBU2036059.1 phosphomannomutase/phosphoglucomutase [Patescibacteria group bacterium]